jgi:hypothetical protein
MAQINAKGKDYGDDADVYQPTHSLTDQFSGVGSFLSSAQACSLLNEASANACGFWLRKKPDYRIHALSLPEYLAVAGYIYLRDHC